MTLLVLLLFTVFLLGTIIKIASMLERKQKGGDLERYRLVFFFVACLMLICLIPLWLSELLTQTMWISNLVVVMANILGWALTYGGGKRERGGGREAKKREKEAPGVGIRTYMVYFQGKPYGLIAKRAFDKLLEYELLKKQRTVELVDDYQAKARKLGVKVQLFKSQDGSQTLIKVEVPEE